jgi:hypothetical protein
MLFSVQAGHEPQSNILTTAPDLAGQARVSITQLVFFIFHHFLSFRYCQLSSLRSCCGVTIWLIFKIIFNCKKSIYHIFLKFRSIKIHKLYFIVFSKGRKDVRCGFSDSETHLIMYLKLDGYEYLACYKFFCKLTKTHTD